MVYVLGAVYAAIWLTLLSNFWYLHRRSKLAPLPSNAPTVSVIIPARNEYDNLQNLLPSLFRQDYPAFEVVIYDDDSTDETGKYLDSLKDPRLNLISGQGPPSGWLGKVYALFRASKHASGEVYLFLDADAVFIHQSALRQLVRKHLALPERSVLTGLPKLTGGALLLVSLVPNAVLAALPWMLVSRIKSPALAALNGQCWMIDGPLYHRLEPHRAVKSEILEDVEIGRYLKTQEVTPVMADVTDEVEVRMYADLADAWRGFRKNAYLIMGGRLAVFIPLLLVFVLLFLVAPYLHWRLFAAFIFLKAATDWRAGIPLWVTVFAPASYFLAVLLQLDSAWHHTRRNVTWKGRTV